MSKPRFTPSKRGFDQARKLPGVQAELNRIGDAIAGDAGPGFEAVEGRPHPAMARTFVQAEDGNTEARRRNRREQLLIRALGKRSE